jgi:pSer/pThr/pTyr-binding forkhead associated (FHA) protein
MAATLIGRTGAVAGKDYAIVDMARIGAAREADIRIQAAGVSRIHARLWREGDDYWIEDAGSTNGTFLSGIRIRKDRLRHLDVLTLGRSVDLIFVVRDDEPGAVASAPPRGILSVTLEPLDGPDAGTPIDVPKGEITFGRADSNNVVVDSRAVSKMHARIERTPDVVRLQDLGSVNGTFVNDIRIDTPVVLGRGDRISLAGVRTFLVSLERDGEAPADVASTPLVDTGPLFSQEWKTRLVWSAEELAELAQLAEPTPEAPPEPEKPAARRPAAAAAKMQAGAAKKISPASKVAPKPTPKSAPAPAASPPQAAAPGPTPPAQVAPEPTPKPAAAPAASPPPAAAPAPPPPVQVAPEPTPKPAPAPAPPPSVQVAPEPQSVSKADLPTVFAGEPPAALPPRVRLVGATTHTLAPGTTTVGRGATATLHVDDRKASREHADIVVTADEVTIEDKDSVNGTVVNDREIRTRQRLAHGDRIKIGETEWTVEIS